MTFKLKKPVKFGSELIEGIEMRRPTVRDLRKLPLELKDYDQVVDVVANLITSCPSVVLDLLSLEDAAAIIEWGMRDFLALSGGGSTSQP